MFSKKQKGYTIVELLVCIFGIGIIIGLGFTIYVLFHFLMKFW